ncbi:HU family DNA-binding protein [Thermosulfuriphilus sp.]
MTINRIHLIRAVHQASAQKGGRGLNRFEATALVDLFFLLIKEAFLKGEDVLLSGFGRFEVRCRGPKKGRNPKTGQEVEIPPSWTVTFRPSRSLRHRLRQPA